ncbi:MAG TPA: zf-HC2 domain-containing protein [Actinomycetota bacterium]
MDCAEVRGMLPEHALGTLGVSDLARVREHLAACAGCRKETGELMEGVEVAALATAAPPPPELEDRVVAAVARAAGRRAGRRRLPVAGLLAAALLLAVGWGAAMAGRAERLGDQAEIARRQAAQAAGSFGEFVGDLSGGGARETVLRSTSRVGAGGRAIVFDSDVSGASDWVLVVVGGLPDEEGPYRAKLRGREGDLPVGRLWPSAEGRLAAYALFGALPGDGEDVVVLDADGAVVLKGRLEAR